MVARASQAAAWINGSFMFCKAATKEASPNTEIQMPFTSASETRRGIEEEEGLLLVVHSNSASKDRPSSSKSLALEKRM